MYILSSVTELHETIKNCFTLTIMHTCIISINLRSIVNLPHFLLFADYQLYGA
jgi:hypothetical protein